MKNNLNCLIANEKNNLTDADIFGSASYRQHLQTITDNCSGKYQRQARVKTEYVPEKKEIAYTDNSIVYINTANWITSSLPSRALKNLSCIGFIGHECAHILYTDFRFVNNFRESISKGKLYPKEPKETDFTKPVYRDNLSELLEVLNEGNVNKMHILSHIASQLSNIVEDGYIEIRMREKFRGTISKGIVLNNLKMMESAPSVKDMEDENYESLSIMFNLILSYCKTGRIENELEISNEFTEVLYDCITCLDEALWENNTKKRMAVVNQLLVFNWSFIKPLLENSDGDSNSNKNSDGDSSGDSSGDPKQNSDGDSNSDQDSESFSDSEVQKIISKLSKEMLSSSTESQNMKTQSITSNGDSSPDPDRMQRELTDIEKMLTEGNGTITREDYTQKTAENDILKVLDEVAEKNVTAALEEELQNQLLEDVKDIDFGNIHRGVDITIRRSKTLNGDEQEKYNSVMLTLKPISKMLQKHVMNVIKQRKRGYTERGLYMGTRLDSSSYHRNDGKIFTNRNRASDEIDLSVGLLIDQSGSMCGSRIVMAQAMALVIYDFCQSLNIPVTIYGHTTEGWSPEKVIMYSYAEFDSVDGNDKYRLMHIDSHECNRDGAAVRYVAEKLCKRSEQKKLFIIVSDGQPAAKDYYGSGAEQDLRSIRKEYVHKGLTFIAAAIGDDKDAIKRCYGEQAFLDISDLKTLPVKMASIIANYALN